MRFICNSKYFQKFQFIWNSTHTHRLFDGFHDRKLWTCLQKNLLSTRDRTVEWRILQTNALIYRSIVLCVRIFLLISIHSTTSKTFSIEQRKIIRTRTCTCSDVLRISSVFSVITSPYTYSEFFTQSRQFRMRKKITNYEIST